MTTRRALATGALAVGSLLLGSIALVHLLTEAPPAGARAQEPEDGALARAPVPEPESRAPPPAVPAMPVPRAAAETAEAPRRGDSLASAGAAPVARAGDVIQVAFQIDPRITKGLHMGARWISPPTYVGTHAGSLFTVHARAKGARSGGAAIRDPTWLADAPDMVAVTPDRGREVEITVLREGRSTLTVADDGVSKTLTVNAVQRSGVWRVDISQ
jgi:hypothetical protein